MHRYASNLLIPHASIFPKSTPEASKLVPLSACIDTFAEAEELKVRQESHSKFDDRSDAQILGSIRFGLYKHAFYFHMFSTSFECA